MYTAGSGCVCVRMRTTRVQQISVGMGRLPQLRIVFVCNNATNNWCMW